MLRRGVIAVALTVACSAGLAATADGAGPIRLAAGFAPAQLGAPTALQLRLSVDANRARSPLTSIRLLYPKSLGVVSSGLGLVACERPASDFEQVIIPTVVGLAGCPPNAVMGYGTARADVRLTDGQVIPELATLTVLSGPFQQGRLGLVIYIDGQRPFGAKLVLAGAVEDAPTPFGGALVVRFPTIPGLEELAVVSLVGLRIVIGSPRIRYYERVGGRTTSYHPDGIVLPRRCPSGGFRFRARLAFEDGSRRRADTVVPCSRFAAPITR